MPLRPRVEEFLGLGPVAERVVGGNAGAAGVSPPGGGRVAGLVEFVFVQGGGAGPVVHGGALQGLARGGLLPWGALGSASHIIGPLIRGNRATITTVLRDDITQLFEAWWDKRPPQRTPRQKAAACKALQRAAVHNWPCPAALDEDELDQPGYTPTARWRYALGTGIATDDPLGKGAKAKELLDPRPQRRRECLPSRSSGPFERETG